MKKLKMLLLLSLFNSCSQLEPVELNETKLDTIFIDDYSYFDRMYTLSDGSEVQEFDVVKNQSKQVIKMLYPTVYQKLDMKLNKVILFKN